MCHNRNKSWKTLIHLRPTLVKFYWIIRVYWRERKRGNIFFFFFFYYSFFLKNLERKNARKKERKKREKKKERACSWRPGILTIDQVLLRYDNWPIHRSSRLLLLLLLLLLIKRMASFKKNREREREKERGKRERENGWRQGRRNGGEKRRA